MSKCSMTIIPHRPVKKKLMTCVMGELITIIMLFTWRDICIMLAGQATLHLTFPKNTISLSVSVSLGVHDITAPSGKHYFTFSFIYVWSSRCVVDSMCFLRYCFVFYFLLFVIQPCVAFCYFIVKLFIQGIWGVNHSFCEHTFPYHAYSTRLMSLVA
jgi:hypothetical protein